MRSDASSTSASTSASASVSGLIDEFLGKTNDGLLVFSGNELFWLTMDQLIEDIFRYKREIQL